MSRHDIGIDLIDIDLDGPRQVYGHTWFSLFSPRVQSYTVGLEPATPTWAAPAPDGTPAPTVTLMEGTDRGLRTGSQGLFPKPYDYAEDAAGVRRVVFSSSAAVYGAPEGGAVTEDHPCRPVSPYGETKLAGEWLVRAAGEAHGIAHGPDRLLLADHALVQPLFHVDEPLALLGR